MIAIKLPTKLLHASLWSVIGTAAAQLALLAANAIAARLLGAQAYGAYGLTYNTASMVATIAGTGVALVAARGVAAIRRHGTADDAREHAKRCLLTALILSVALGLAVGFSATWFSATVLRNPTASSYLWAAAALGAFLTNSQVRYTIWRAYNNFVISRSCAYRPGSSVPLCWRPPAFGTMSMWRSSPQPSPLC